MKILAIVFDQSFVESVKKQTVQPETDIVVNNWAECNAACSKYKDYDVVVLVKEELFPEYIEKTIEPIKNAPKEIGMVYADSTHVFRPGFYVVTLGRWNYSFGSVTINAESFESVGSLFNAQEQEPIQEFASRLVNHGLLYHIPEVLSGEPIADQVATSE